MQAIDDIFLEELGLGSVPEDERDRMIVDIQETLAERIGKRAEDHLDAEKQAELEKIGSQDPSQLTSWLEQNLPSYNHIIKEETAKIKEEIRPQVPKILSDIAAGVPNPNA